MKRVFALAVVASLALPSLAFAQTASVPAPRGHRQPTAADVPSNTAIPVTTDSLPTGRSVSRGKSIDKTDIDTGPTETAPQICTNCDD